MTGHWEAGNLYTALASLLPTGSMGSYFNRMSFLNQSSFILPRQTVLLFYMKAWFDEMAMMMEGGTSCNNEEMVMAGIIYKGYESVIIVVF
jgi:hypothetical protein